MIQRLQSVYLLLTTIFALLFLSGEILSFSSALEKVFYNLSGIISTAQGTVSRDALTMISSVILMAIPVLSLVIIFIYKNRKLQMRLTLVLIVAVLIEIVLLFLIMFNVERKLNAEVIPGIKHVLPLLMLLTSILAYQGISKDENLVRSYDRLR